MSSHLTCRNPHKLTCVHLALVVSALIYTTPKQAGAQEESGATPEIVIADKNGPAALGAGSGSSAIAKNGSSAQQPESIATGGSGGAGESATQPSAPLGAVPPEDGKDWLQLESGEWLTGQVLHLREATLSFHSETLGDQELDLGDVRQLFVRSPTRFGLTRRRSLEGTAFLDEEGLVVFTKEGPRAAARGELIIILRAAERELERWSLDVSLGLNVAQGNSEMETLSASATLERETQLTDLELDYFANYGRSDGQVSTHNHRGVGRFDIFVTRSIFVVPAYVVAEYDRFRNLKLRGSVLGLVGARVLDDDGLRLALSLGSGYQQQRLISSETRSDLVQHNALFAAITTFDANLTDELEFKLDYTNQVAVTEPGLTTHRLKTTLDFDMASVFDLELTFVFNRIERPLPDAEGVRPKQNDLQFIASIGIELG